MYKRIIMRSSTSNHHVFSRQTCSCSSEHWKQWYSSFKRCLTFPTGCLNGIKIHPLDYFTVRHKFMDIQHWKQSKFKLLKKKKDCIAFYCSSKLLAMFLIIKKEKKTEMYTSVCQSHLIGWFWHGSLSSFLVRDEVEQVDGCYHTKNHLPQGWGAICQV